MSKKRKIAIYSGTVPTTTFIENLIKCISKDNIVYVFGKKKFKVKYNSKYIKLYLTFPNSILNLFSTILRVLLLLLFYPKRINILLDEIKPLDNYYEKYIWLSRYAPVLLHLPDVFHLQWGKKIDRWFFLQEKLGCKIVLSLRGSHINYSPISDLKLKNQYKQYFPKINAFHAVSESIGIEAQKYGALHSRIFKINSFISPEVLEMFSGYVDRSSDTLKLISIGRDHWVKGYSIALDVCKILNDLNYNFEYRIVAGLPISEKLLFQRNQLELEDKVFFIDLMPQEEIFNMLKEQDLLLLPSISEGIANVVLESMAIGVPVITSDCGGMSEVIKNNDTGWIVPVFDSKSMAKAIINFKQTSMENRKKIVFRAHEFIKNEFNQENAIKKFNHLYNDLFK